MSEAGDFELFGAPAAKEHDEKNDEKFREEMRRAQQAMQQLQKEEGQARAHDDKLAQIIVQFLRHPGNTDLFLLISRCVAQDIPSEIIIAVLSLVDRKASEEITKILKEAKEKALTVPQHQGMHSLSPGQKQQINEWIGNVTTAAYSKPHRTLETILIKRVPEGQTEVVQELFAPFVQLSAFILRNHLAMQNTPMEYEKLRDFMQQVYLKMVQDLEVMVQGQGRLEGKKEN